MKRSHSFVARLLMSIASLGLGCSHHHCSKHGCASCGNHAPLGAIAAPVGTYVGRWRCHQTLMANRERVVLTSEDWNEETDSLTDYAKRKLLDAIRRPEELGGGIIIEPNGTPALDGLRMESLSQFLATNASAFSADQIEIAFSDNRGAQGAEAERIAQQFSQRNTNDDFVDDPTRPFGNTPFRQSPYIIADFERRGR